MKIKKLGKMLVSRPYLKDSCKLAFFGGLLCSVYKAVLCLLRRMYKEDETELANRRAAPIAGFIAGLTILFENQFRK
jgi:hypothetical protein